MSLLEWIKVLVVVILFFGITYFQAREVYMRAEEKSPKSGTEEVLKYLVSVMILSAIAVIGYVYILKKIS